MFENTIKYLFWANCKIIGIQITNNFISKKYKKETQGHYTKWLFQIFVEYGNPERYKRGNLTLTTIKLETRHLFGLLTCH